MTLTLRGISKRYGANEVLPPLDLAIEAGEFLTLLGPSGSGKTTVLRLIGGFTAPHAGSILLDGQDITGWPANRRPFNTVFQDYALFPHMTVAQNVGYGPMVQGRDRAQARLAVAATLETVGLAELAGRYPAQLSGGQRQRVALARAIVCEPRLILLDEPLSALDAGLRRQMQSFLKQLQRRIRTTFVFVTHDQEEAITMSDRTVVMNRGRVEQVGSPVDLYRSPRTHFVAGFFGENNVVPGRSGTAPRVVETALGPLRAEGGAVQEPGTPCAWVLRPEALRVASTGDPAGGIPGTVDEVTFLGPAVRVAVRPVAAPATRLELRCGEGARVPVEGEAVTLAFAPADAVIVPLEGPAGNPTAAGRGAAS